VATHCEEEVSTQIKSVTALLEPAIVMFLGSVVGSVVISLLLPIFSLSQAMKPKM
jgi:type IV pilus assembly protein PilC